MFTVRRRGITGGLAAFCGTTNACESMISIVRDTTRMPVLVAALEHHMATVTRTCDTTKVV